MANEKVPPPALKCEICQAPVLEVCEWGGTVRTLCDVCMPDAYAKWKSESEDTYP